MDLSEAALNARRLNAQKSTGPRTEEGKARSRRNALKHGMAGKGVVLNEEDAAEVEHRVGAWSDDLAPRGATEHWLVGQAAIASVRVERCQRGEVAALNRRRREAVRLWDEQRELEVADLVSRFATESYVVWRQLRRTSEGCDWMIRQWSILADALETPGHWSNSRCFHAFRLLGLTSVPHYVPGEPCAELALAALVLLPEAGLPQIAYYLLGPDSQKLPPEALVDALGDRLPDRESSRERLRAIVAAEIAGLVARRDFLRENFDLPDRIEAPDRALNDPSREAELSRRYEATHTANLHRCLQRLALGRKQNLWLGIDPTSIASDQEEAAALPDGETEGPGEPSQSGQALSDQESQGSPAPSANQDAGACGEDGPGEDPGHGGLLTCPVEEGPGDPPTRPLQGHPLPGEAGDFWPLLPLGVAWDQGQPPIARRDLPTIGDAVASPSARNEPKSDAEELRERSADAPTALPARNEPKSGIEESQEPDAGEPREAGETGSSSHASAPTSPSATSPEPREGEAQANLNATDGGSCDSKGTAPAPAEPKDDHDTPSGHRAAGMAAENGPGAAGAAPRDPENPVWDGSLELPWVPSVRRKPTDLP